MFGTRLVPVDLSAMLVLYHHRKRELVVKQDSIGLAIGLGGGGGGVDVAVLDPFRGYAAPLRTHLGGATVVLDAFHVTRLGFATVDDVRRRVQRETTGHRGHKGDPLYGIRRLLRRGVERLSPVA